VVVVHLMPLLFGVGELMELQAGDMPVAEHGQSELAADVDPFGERYGSLLGTYPVAGDSN
jgi:hypothetical protein